MDKGLKERLEHVANSEFGRVSYTEAVEVLKKVNDQFDFKVEWGTDLQTEHERYLTEQVFKRPVFVTDYPKEIKAFYMRQNDDGKTCLLYTSPHGELMSRFTNDADNVQMALEQSVVSLCSSCLMFVGLVAMMLFINWKLFLVTALLLIVTVYLFRTLGGRSRKYYQQQQSALGDVNGEIQDCLLYTSS